MKVTIVVMYVVLVITELLHSQIRIIYAFLVTIGVISAMAAPLINAIHVGEIIGKKLIQIHVSIKTFKIIFMYVGMENIRFLVLYQMVFVIALFVIVFA